MRTQLNALNASMSLDDIKAALQALQQQKVGLAERLEPLRQGRVKPVSEQERKQVEEDAKLWEKRLKTRERIECELWAIVWDGKIAEGVRKEKKGEIWEELGCEGEVP